VKANLELKSGQKEEKEGHKDAPHPLQGKGSVSVNFERKAHYWIALVGGKWGISKQHNLD